MKHCDFAIDTEFFTDAGQWRCTDVGTRVIVAIKISDIQVTTSDGEKLTTKTISDDPSWFNGPPYAVAGQVFDEDSMPGCWT
jgi:hypothetical protein